MCVEDKNKLYKEKFSAWNFGLVNDVLYNKYKSFGSFPIELNYDVSINPMNLKYIEALYDLFHDFSAAQLVNLSHQKGSPCHNIYSKYEGAIPKYEKINKKETKEWFKSLVDIK